MINRLRSEYVQPEIVREENINGHENNENLLSQIPFDHELSEEEIESFFEQHQTNLVPLLKQSIEEFNDIQFHNLVLLY